MIAALPQLSASLLTHGPIGVVVVRAVRIIVILAGAVLLRLAAGRGINRVVASTREGGMGRRIALLGQRAAMLVDTSEAAVQRRRQRAATIGTVLRNVTNAVIGVVAFATVLGEIGINLAPILASAGIVGVAVGFGAQNLVRDFLSGLFLVLEDTYGVGDVVDLGPATGVVETIGLRSTRIRDVRGSLWSVRNGEISRVANFSQSWQRALFDLLLLPGQDIDRAREVMLAAAGSLAVEQPGVVLEEPAVWGVNEIRPDGVVLRLAVRRRPFNDAFDRALRERLVHDLAEAGVRIFMLPADLRLLDPAGEQPLAQLELGRVR